MDAAQLITDNNLEYIVKDICVLERKDAAGLIRLPFYADGFPGLMFIQSANAAVLWPSGKKLSEFLLYGQTLDPIEIHIDGSYKLICFRLYPISVKALFHVNARDFNNSCFDLSTADAAAADQTIALLKASENTDIQVSTMAAYLNMMAVKPCCSPEWRIQSAVSLILKSKGNISVNELSEKLNVTERTLQRLFIAHTGVSPKQFAKIIKFQASVQLLSQDTNQRLTDIVFETGYADQSHFIKNFKKYTGKIPSKFKNLK